MKKTIKLVATFLVLCAMMTLLVGQSGAASTNQIAASVASTVHNAPVWKSYAQLLQENAVRPAQQVLQVNLSYSAERNPHIVVSDMRRFNAYVPTYANPDAAEDSYELKVLDAGGNAIYNLAFAVHSDLFFDSADATGKLAGGRLEPKEVQFALTIPWFENGSSLAISNKTGEQIANAALSQPKTEANTPDFYSTTGDAILGTKRGGANNPETGGYLDLVFVGDDYTSLQLGQFHDDVNRFTNHMVGTYEPYHTRASQIRFSYVDNTDDLQCVYSAPPFERLLTCNWSVVTARVNSAGVPYDKIFVIVNNPAYGGSGLLGGPVGVAYNGSLGRQVFVHEFGHEFGRLRDEYDYGSIGPIDNLTHENCFAGTAPPATEWIPFVALGDYSLVCEESNWYRPSPQSLMRDLNYEYFNAISQRLINDQLTTFAGTFVDNVNPLSVIAYPSNGAVVSGLVRVTTSLSDNNGVAWAGLWKDGVLYHTEYVQPFAFDYDTTTDRDGPHTLQLRAYDTVGNIGQSANVAVTVRNAITSAGRMTGGGNVSSISGARVTHSLELQCNPSRSPNNLQVNWGRGNRFNLSALSTASCTDDPSIDPGQPPANFDTYTGTGTGTYNGVAGARAEWTFTDAGEPGRGVDHVRLLIRDASNTTVLSVNAYLDGGNQQAQR